MINILFFTRPVFSEDLRIMGAAKATHMSVCHRNAAACSNNNCKCDQHVWKGEAIVRPVFTENFSMRVPSRGQRWVIFLDIDNQPGTLDNNNNIDNDFKNDLPMIRKMQIYWILK